MAVAYIAHHTSTITSCTVLDRVMWNFLKTVTCYPVNLHVTELKLSLLNKQFMAHEYTSSQNSLHIFSICIVDTLNAPVESPVVTDD
jgi:hypothetical protein